MLFLPTECRTAANCSDTGGCNTGTAAWLGRRTGADDLGERGGGPRRFYRAAGRAPFPGGWGRWARGTSPRRWASPRGRWTATTGRGDNEQSAYELFTGINVRMYRVKYCKKIIIIILFF